MNKDEFTNTLEIVKKLSQKRNFKQSYDLVVNLKDINVKKEPVDFFATLHYSIGKKASVCALVGPELLTQAKEVCDEAISVDDFPKYQKDKKLLKKLGKTHNYFIAQATIMPKVAAAFGRVLGPQGKMPNPKAGCVVPPNANLKQLYERLQKMVHVNAKIAPTVQVMVGKEEMEDSQVIDNMFTLYDQLIHNLKNETNNIKNMLVKTTMGKPIKVGEKLEDIEKKQAEAEKQAEEQKEAAKKEAAAAKKKKPVKKKEEKAEKKEKSAEKDKKESAEKEEAEEKAE